MLVFELLEHFQSVVFAMVIYEDDLQGPMCLRHDRVKRLLHHLGAVINGYDDSE